MRAPAAWIFALAFAACTDGATLERASVPDAWLDTWRDEVDGAGTTAPDAEPPDVDTSPLGDGTCGEAVRVLRVDPWPGGGVSIAVELAGPDGPAAVAEAHATLDAVAAPIASAWEPSGVTGLVLLDPALRADALTFLDALPDGEVVVVWAGASLEAEATTDHAHARARLAAATVAGTPDWGALRAALGALGGPTGPLARTLVVAGDAPVLVAGPVRVVALAPDLAADLLARRVGLARVGACPGAAAGERLTLAIDGVACDVVMPAPEGHLAGEVCDAAAAAGDAWPYGTRVDIVMDAAETAVWEARKAAKSKEDFSGKVRLGAGEALPAALHFRGQTSLDCERKSYNIDLVGPDRRRFAPGVASDELYLISMCKDDGHYNQILGDRLAAQLGLFPLGFRPVNLFVNDLDQGIYLLLEDPIEGLKDDATALAAVVRRRLDQDGNPPEAEHSAVDDAWALAAYAAMHDAAADGIAALEAYLDLDGYLRWVALSVMLHNGDYIDEIMFHGSLEAGADHPWFRVMGWDPDDLWSDCHRNGAAAIPDPNGLMYCVEGNIDHVLFANPDVYARFVDHLEALLAAYPMERMTAEMAAVRDVLFARMTSDATALAMIELHAGYPESVTAAGWKSAVEGKMNRDLDRHAAWRTELLDKIAAWREAR